MPRTTRQNRIQRGAILNAWDSETTVHYNRGGSELHEGRKNDDLQKSASLHLSFRAETFHSSSFDSGDKSSIYRNRSPSCSPHGVVGRLLSRAGSKI
jgi:hypothetical protein